jgi:hypothetical protein
MTPMQIAIVMNIESVSNAMAPPTRVEVPLSVMSSHCTIASTPAAPAIVAVANA